MIDFLKHRFAETLDADAIIWRDKRYSYQWLLTQLDEWSAYLQRENVTAGTITVLEADFSAQAVAMFLALIDACCVLVPLTSSLGAKRDDYRALAQSEVILRMDDEGHLSTERTGTRAKHALYTQLRTVGHPGLVLFSSGSTGESKAAVHDFTNLLIKFHRRRHNLRTLTFMLFDHIGGVDTLLYSLSNASCIITVEDRSPDSICRAVEEHRVEVLPVTPTFLNLLLLSEAHTRYDMSSLKYITYGTEVMPDSLLQKVSELFPNVTLLQKYGTTEIGTPSSKSKSSNSPWMKIGGQGYESRIVDGQLQIKASSAMLGYLNAPSPFTDDGWFITGDTVIQDGEYIRILGRASEIINVGGEKVFPAEVEGVIQQMEEITEAVVYGEPNPLIGYIVCARVRAVDNSDPREIASRVKRFCRERLENFKVPVKVDVVDVAQHSPRFKKMRRSTSSQS